MAVELKSLPTRADTTSPVVVVTGWRDPDRSRWIPTLSTAWTDPTSLTRPVVAMAAPAIGARRVGEILRDLLFAMGKSPYVTGGAKTDDGELDVPAAWLLARETREIIVNDAARLPHAVVRALVELATGVDARIWLIGHHNRASDLDDLVEDWNADEWTLDEFDQAWERPDELPAKTLASPPEARRTDLPATSALTFRADCRRQLTADRFEQVDALYREELTTARRHLAERAGQERLDHEAIAMLLRRRIRVTSTTDQAVTTVRAIEAAALPFGFYVDVDLPSLINAAERNPRPGRNTLDDAAALDAYTRPAYATACALAMVEIPPTEMLALTVGDVAEDGTSVTTPDGITRIPEQLRPYVVAQMLTRQFAGAALHDPFILNEKGKPAPLSWVARTIKLAEVECAVRLARPRYDRKRLAVFPWLTTHGIAVRSIHGKSRRSPRS